MYIGGLGELLLAGAAGAFENGLLLFSGVTHYLCVKCGELSMKVVWRAGMAMV